MRIANINTNINFGRIIPLKTKKDKPLNFHYAQELRDVLNCEKTKVYNQDQAKRIRKFFQEVLGDYNGKGGIQVKPYSDGFCLVSGKDAQIIKTFSKTRAKEYIDNKIENGNNRKPITEITVYYSNPKKNIPSNIIYSNITESYIAIQDGTRTEKPDDNRAYFLTKDCIYEEKVLKP